MRRLLITFTLVGIAFFGFTQENMINVTGGYAWMNMDDSEYFSEDPNLTGTGWRITGTYDFNPNEGKIAYGFSVGYSTVDADYAFTGDSTANYKMNSVPFYFAPKLLFGSEKFKAFVKLMIGGQSATLKRTGTASEISASDFGFYGGGGAGFNLFVHEKIFILAEYEIAYVTNNYYRNGLFQSVSAGLGIRF